MLINKQYFTYKASTDYVIPKSNEIKTRPDVCYCQVDSFERENTEWLLMGCCILSSLLIFLVNLHSAQQLI